MIRTDTFVRLVSRRCGARQDHVQEAPAGRAEQAASDQEAARAHRQAHQSSRQFLGGTAVRFGEGEALDGWGSLPF